MALDGVSERGENLAPGPVYLRKAAQRFVNGQADRPEMVFTLVGQECTLRCQHCCTHWGQEARKQSRKEQGLYGKVWTQECLLQLVADMKAEGVRTWAISSEGELMHPKVLPMLLPALAKAAEEGLETALYTNGVHLTQELTQLLLGFKIALIGKLNSIDPALNQASLGRSRDADMPLSERGGRSIPTFIAWLLDSGFADDGLLALNTVIDSTVAETVLETRGWMHEQGIAPMAELLELTGPLRKKALQQRLVVPPDATQQLVTAIGELDREFGYTVNYVTGEQGDRYLDVRKELNGGHLVLDSFGRFGVTPGSYEARNNVPRYPNTSLGELLNQVKPTEYFGFGANRQFRRLKVVHHSTTHRQP